MHKEKLSPWKAAAGAAVFLLAEACGSNTPATQTPTRTPEVTPSPVPTLNVTPSPEITPSPTIVVTPSPEITPSPTIVVTPSPEITPSPTQAETATPEALKNGTDVVEAEHKKVTLDVLAQDAKTTYENNPAGLRAYEAYIGSDQQYNPENLTNLCGTSSMWEDKASYCETLINGMMKSYIDTRDINFYNLTVEGYSFFIAIKDIPNAEKTRFKDELENSYK